MEMFFKSNWASFALKSHVKQHLPSCLSGPDVYTAESLPGRLLLFIHTNLCYLSHLFDLYLTRRVIQSKFLLTVVAGRKVKPPEGREWREKDQ